MNDNGSFSNYQPNYNLFAHGAKLFSCYDDSIKQETFDKISTKIETKEDVKMDTSEVDLTVPLFPIFKYEFYEDKFLLKKYLKELDSSLRQLGYRITPINTLSKESDNSEKTPLFINGCQINRSELYKSLNERACVKNILLPAHKQKRLKRNEGACVPKRCRHESKVRLSLPSETRNHSHQLSEYGRNGRNYRACDPLNFNDMYKAQVSIDRKFKTEEKQQAIERQKDSFSKRGVFGEYSNNVLMPED